MGVQNQIDPPDLSAVLGQVKRDTGVNLNCIQIGIIESFDPAKQLASIRLALKQVVDIAPDGTKVLKEHPVLLRCPVTVLYGGDSYITFPIAPGDNCIVLFNDREIDQWLYNGTEQTQIPMSARTHDISDGIAIVGLRSLQNSIANYLVNGIRLNSGSQIDITADMIETIAETFLHTGDLEVTGSIHAGNGFNGTVGTNAGTKNVVDGIIIE